MVFEVEFKSFDASVSEVLSAASFPDVLAASGKNRIILKPNLVSDQPPPVTTHVEIVAAVVDYLQAYCLTCRVCP
ncbi:MAG: DUF362 domain-containing protein [Kiritimatiellaeota bacterium]|nr:DUF362 domain-containing protein [Kiritimatiellota bacterium]